MHEGRYGKSGRVDLAERRSSGLTVLIPTIVMAAALLMGAGRSTGDILDSSDFLAVRHLVPPEDPAVDNRDYQAGGISGAGDVFGMVNSARGHETNRGCHCENPVVWKRSEGYQGKLVFGGLPYFTPLFAFNLGLDLQDDLDGGVITDAIRQEWANQGLSLADNTELTVNTPGASWTVHEPPYGSSMP